MLEYHGKLVLAPMVRVSELPMRALSIKYGCDLVWGPEIIDKKMIHMKRIWNDRLQCVDFVQKSDEKLVFRTSPALEKSRLVFQMGTADAKLAVAAAKVVAADVGALDVNSGCPKHFSVHGGMGAALLRTPDKLVDILTSLVEEVGKPFGIPISVKIRILEDAEKTYALVRRLVVTGISCLTVHCRTAPMRPREPALYTYLAGIAQICHEAGIYCYVNGDVGCRDNLDLFMRTYGVDGAMIARGAEANPSCFQSGPLVPWIDVCKEFLEVCKKYEYTNSHAKFCLTRMIPGRDPLYQLIAQSKSLEEMQMMLEMATGEERVSPNPAPTPAMSV